MNNNWQKGAGTLKTVNAMQWLYWQSIESKVIKKRAEENKKMLNQFILRSCVGLKIIKAGLLKKVS